MMFLLIIPLAVLWGTLALAQNCDPVDFGKGTVVCQCNSTYCDYYPDPESPKSGAFIWYSTSKNGKRLERNDGQISKELGKGSIVKIDATNQYQTIEGFGGAFTDSATMNIKSLSESTQDHLMRSYFSTDGSKYNLGRVPIAGCDFSTRGYTYDDSDGDTTLANFSLAAEDTEFKIPLMQKALKLNPELRFLAAAWTAPPWMKNNKKYNGYGYLLDEYYQIYANYIIKFLEEYKKNNLEIWAVSTGNEPYTSLTEVVPIIKINSMYWSSKTVSKWVVNNLGPTIQKSKSSTTSILMLDDQRLALLPYVKDIKNKYSEALNYIKGFAIHWYTDDLTSPNLIDSAHELVPDKFMLMTEASLGFYPWELQKVILGSWDRADTQIKKMFQNLNHWVVGWLDWNLALNPKGGPNWVGVYVDAPIIVDADKGVFYKQPYYYVITHFSKFVPRGSIKIQAKSNNDDILSIAFKTQADQKVVLLYNKSGNKLNASVVDDTIGTINVELPEYSLHTILY